MVCFVLLAITAQDLSAQTKNSCLDCHAKLDAPLGVSADDYAASIHGQKGLKCTACHGGDSSSDDLDRSMSPAAGFKRVDRSKIPSLCAKCHSDPAYMRGFDPSLRTDQFSQYQTSVHGQLLAKGDPHVAVCTDCHTAHAVRAPNDPRSSVYPVNVAQTCANCHANVDYMKGYKIPTNQFALYSTSVHHEALAVGGDLSAPTCSTCHGSHGAAPPGVASVERVCATCHVFQEQLFNTSLHKSVFEAMSLPGCITCHSNHGIQKPSDAMIGTGKDAICVKCHSPGESAYDQAGTMHTALVNLDAAIARSDELLTRAANSGVEVGASKLALTEARDDLTKARVTIHAASADAVNQNIQAGLKVTQKTYQAGLDAMAELRHRRMGLMVSVVAIIWVLIGLAITIRKLESEPAGPTKDAGR